MKNRQSADVSMCRGWFELPHHWEFSEDFTLSIWLEMISFYICRGEFFAIILTVHGIPSLAECSNFCYILT